VYIPQHFEETSFENIKSLIEDYPLSILIAHTSDGMIANHIPILMEGDELIGHIALNNDLHKLIGEKGDILAIFRGPDAYISPNWYPSKKLHGEHVPTWNYTTAHIYGEIEFFHDDKTKSAIVGKPKPDARRQTISHGSFSVQDK